MKAKFVSFLEIIGVGYKAITDPQGKKIKLKVGYSHDIELEAPPTVRVYCPGRAARLICCTGTNYQAITQFAAQIKSCRPPENFKGKGIRYRDEIINQKQGGRSGRK